MRDESNSFPNYFCSRWAGTDYTKNFLVTGVQSMNCPIPGQIYLSVLWQQKVSIIKVLIISQQGNLILIYNTINKAWELPVPA